jgi:hypothetical protein
MAEATTWYELVGWHRPSISKRLVSSETAAYVFHPNGRKSLKKSNRGQDWFKTFQEAKTELLRRSHNRIIKLDEEMAQEKQNLESINKLTEETCQQTV